MITTDVSASDSMVRAMRSNRNYFIAYGLPKTISNEQKTELLSNNDFSTLENNLIRVNGCFARPTRRLSTQTFRALFQLAS